MRPIPRRDAFYACPHALVTLNDKSALAATLSWPHPACKLSRAAETTGAEGATGDRERATTAQQRSEDPLAHGGHNTRQQNQVGSTSGNTKAPTAASERPSNRRQYLRRAVDPAQMSCELDARCVTLIPNGNGVHRFVDNGRN